MVQIPSSTPIKSTKVHPKTFNKRRAKMAAGGTIKLDAILAKVFKKKEGATITGMELTKGLWAYIRENNLQVKTTK
jgi:chromatin remodeling complex protein RSC6